MRIQRFSFLGSLLLLVLVSFSSYATPFNKIVFFGDSLSDNGNLYAYDLGYLPKSPPYYQGRFSNDIVWSEQVAQELSDQYQITSVNYAFGGETAIFHNPARGFLPYTLTASRESYLLHTAFQDRKSTLFIIWIGANDYLHDSTDTDGLTTSVVDSIKNNINSLISRGGMNFLVINLPDMGKTPYAIENESSELLSTFIRIHNEKLATIVTDIQNAHPDINIKLYDVASSFKDLLEHPDYYNKKYHLNIKYLDQACWQGGYSLRYKPVAENEIAEDIEKHLSKTTIIASAKATGNNFSVPDFANFIQNSPALKESYWVSKSAAQGNGEPCNNPDEYIFWDRLHPNKILHTLVGKGIKKFILRNFDISD